MRTCAFRDLSPAFHLCNVGSFLSPDMNLDKLKLILVPTDFSEPSAIALRAAVRLAQAFGASIEMLHVASIRRWSCPRRSTWCRCPLFSSASLPERPSAWSESSVRCARPASFARARQSSADRSRRSSSTRAGAAPV